MQNYPEELAELEERYAELEKAHSECKRHTAELQAQLEKRQADAVDGKHKVGVTLTNGMTRYYEADKAQHTYRTVATARWSEIAEVHKPSA